MKKMATWRKRLGSTFRQVAVAVTCTNIVSSYLLEICQTDLTVNVFTVIKFGIFVLLFVDCRNLLFTHKVKPAVN